METPQREQPGPGKTNRIQIELIKMSGLDPMDWVEKNAANFRQLIEEEPDLIARYEQEPEKTLHIIKQKLQTDHTD